MKYKILELIAFLFIVIVGLWLAEIDYITRDAWWAVLAISTMIYMKETQ